MKQIRGFSRAVGSGEVVEVTANWYRVSSGGGCVKILKLTMVNTPPCVNTLYTSMMSCRLRELSLNRAVFLLFFVLGSPRAYRVLRPGIRSKAQMQTMPKLQQRQILNPLCRARDRTFVLVLQRHC